MLVKKLYGGLIALGLKLGPKVFGLFTKILKSTKAVKVGLAGASLGSYAVLFTWEFAIMICVMLFVHESGHVWAMKKCGVKTRGFYFIPFLGGAAVADEAFPSRKAEVFIALMGPLWGLALSVFVAGIYLVTDNPLFAASASWMAMINLFNLLPINPLDGGRVFKSIAFSVHDLLGFLFLGLGIAACMVAVVMMKMGLFLFILIIGTVEVILEYGRYRKGEKEVAHLRLEETAISMSIEASQNPELMKLERANIRRRLTLATKKYAIKPRMGMAECINWAMAYGIILTGLWYVMYRMQHIPGSDVAMELMRG